MTVAEGTENLMFCLCLVSLVDSLNSEILPRV